jgi:hypothetical protein
MVERLQIGPHASWLSGSGRCPRCDQVLIVPSGMSVIVATSVMPTMSSFFISFLLRLVTVPRSRGVKRVALALPDERAGQVL